MEDSGPETKPKRKPYEAPACEQVTLEVRASVLSACLTSIGVTPYGGSCARPYSSCYTTHSGRAAKP